VLCFFNRSTTYGVKLTAAARALSLVIHDVVDVADTLVVIPKLCKRTPW